MPFIIKLTVDAINSVLAGTTTITLPISGHNGLTVDWGIGESPIDYINGENITFTVPDGSTHQLVQEPATVTITGIFTKFGTDVPPPDWNPEHLVSIDQWGSAPIQDLSYACAGAINLVSVPATLPSTVTNVSHMFNQVGDSFGTNIVNWDVSGVTDFDFFLSEYGGMNDTTLSNLNSPFNKAAMKLYFSSGISTLPIDGIDGNIGIDWGDGNMTYANGSIPSAPQPVYTHVTVYVYGKFTTFGGNNSSPQFLVRVDSWGTNNTILSNLSYAFVDAGYLMTVPNTLPSTVTNVEGMFKNAYATSPPLYGVPTQYSSWNMANVTDLNFMFDSDYFDTSPTSSTMSPPDISSSTIFGQTITIATKKSMVYNFTIRKEDTLNYDSTRTWSQSPFYIDPMELVISGSSGFLGPLELPISGIVGNITVVWVEAGTGGVTNTIQASYVDLELVSFPSGPSIPSAEFTVRIFGYFTNFSVDIEPATSTVGWPGSQALLNMSAFGKNPILTSLKGAFAFCNSMNSSPPSTLPTSVTNLSYLCFKAISAVGIPAWNTTNVTDMAYAFAGSTINNSNAAFWNISGITKYEKFAFFITITASDGIKDLSISSTGSPFRNRAMAITVLPSYVGAIQLSDIGTDGIAIDYNVGSGAQYVGPSGYVPDPFFTNSSVNGTIYIYGSFGHFGAPDLSGHQSAEFITGISSWGTSNSNLTSLANAFNGGFNGGGKTSTYANDQQTLTLPSLPSTVTNLSGMFANCPCDISGISLWDLSGVTDTSYMFYQAREGGIPGKSRFNSDIRLWNVSNVTEMSGMFNGAYKFDKNISTWNTGTSSTPLFFFSTLTNNPTFNEISSPSVTDTTTTDTNSPFYSSAMTLTFTGTGLVTLPIEGNYTIDWGNGLLGVNDPTGTPVELGPVKITGTVTRFGNGPLSWNGASRLTALTGWGDVSGLVDLSGAFYGATSLTQVPTTLPSTVTNLSYMFYGATVFNGDISGWNTGAVKNMANMFGEAQAFNQDISGWNTVVVTDMSFMFAGAVDFNQNLSTWNTAAVKNMSNMFAGATRFNGDISTWNTAVVTNMSFMFYNATVFNGNISGWNTGAVTNMANMFEGAMDFNGNISGWNTEVVTDMANMFQDATAFNGDISGWNTGAVTDMTGMFGEAQAFNRNLSTWDTGAVTNMSGMFYGATAFNQNLTGWNTEFVIDMTSMFGGATKFNGDISGWNTGSVTNMSYMFQDATAFNRNISGWNTGDVTDMRSMFYNATAFNKNLSTWVTGAVTNMASMFTEAVAFNSDLSTWNTAAVTDMTGMFFNASAQYSNGLLKYDYSVWSVSSVTESNSFLYIGGNETTTTDPYSPFSLVQPYMALTFNDNVFVELPIEGNYTIDWGNESSIGVNDPSGTPVGPGPVKIRGTVTRFGNGPQSWTGASRLTIVARWGDVSGLVDLSGAFYGATSLTQVPTTLPSTVTNLSYMFYGATVFNGDISGWNTGAVKNMANMFEGAMTFNRNLSTWNTEVVTDMTSMFAGAVDFNQNLSTWNTAAVKNMSNMFAGATRFNGDISTWNTVAVTNMSSMFYNVTDFNSDLSGWNTGAVKNMSGMFAFATDFNRNLSTWNTEVVTDMAFMFYNATKFNGDISGWNTAAVTDMANMFEGAMAFNRNLSTWNTGVVTDMTYMFYGAKDFNGDISGWNTGAVTNMSLMFAGATAFTADLSGWAYKLGPVVNYTDFFTRGTGGMNNFQDPTIQSPRSPFYTGIPTPSNPYVPAASLVVFDTPPNPTIKVGTEVFGTVGSVLYRLNPSYISIAVLSTGTFVGTLYRPYIANMSISNKIYGAHTGGKLFSYDTVTRTLDLSAGTYQGTPTGYMALDTNGNLYSTDSSGYIYKLAYATSTFVALNTTALLPPVIGPLSVVNDEFLYGADSENRIVRVSISGMAVERSVAINIAPKSLIVDLSGRPYYYDVSGYGLWALYPLAKLHDFSGNPLDGTQPVGPIRMDPTKRVLYGICAAGGRGLGTGFRGAGTLFSFDLSSSAYSVLVNYVAGDVNRGETPLNFSITTETGTAYVTTRSSSTTFQTRIVGPRVANGYAVGSAQLPGATTTCFNHGTKILSLINNIEAWIPVENLNIGDLVMTYWHGPRPITHIFKGVMINNPGVWHTCMYKGQREGFEPLLVTGGHGLLVDYLTEEEQAKQQKFWGRNEVVIDDKIVMIAPVSAEFTQITDRNIYTYYHFVVENDGDNDRRYGVYANGFLTETPSKNQAVVLKYKDHSVY